MPATLEFFRSGKYGLRSYCRECDREYSRNHYQEHKDEYQANFRRRYEANKQSVADYVRQWALEHPDLVAEYKRRYRQSHKEERRAGVRNYRAKKKLNGGSHTAQDVREQYERQDGRCFYCGLKVADDYHVDHVVPIALGGSNGPQNLVIACVHCNTSKRHIHPMDFCGRML